MGQTARVYKFDETVDTSYFASRHRSVRALERFADRVWRQEQRPGMPDLELKFPRKSFGCSWCDTADGFIQIDPTQRSYVTMLHEIAHILEPDCVDHGPRFMRTYVNLLVKYGQCCEADLLINAALYGIEVDE